MAQGEFLAAVKAGDVARVEELLGADEGAAAAELLKEVTEDGESALHLAVKEDNAALASALVMGGADPNAKDNTGNTPLHDCGLFDAGAVAEVLLTFGVGADVAAAADDGDLPVHTAARGSAAVLRQLFNHKPVQEGVERVGSLGHTALLKAASFEDPACLQLLIQAGASLAATSAQGQTALHLAAEAGLADCCKVLLEAGVDADVADEEQHTALWAAVEAWELDAASVLAQVITAETVQLADGEGLTVLHAACALKAPDIAMAIVTAAQERLEAAAVASVINGRCPQQAGRTPLLTACRQGHTAVVQQMCGTPGVDPALPDADLDTPLHVAATRRDGAMVAALLQAARAINAPPEDPAEDAAPAAPGDAPPAGGEGEGEEPRGGAAAGPPSAGASGPGAGLLPPTEPRPAEEKPGPPPPPPAAAAAAGEVNEATGFHGSLLLRAKQDEDRRWALLEATAASRAALREDKLRRERAGAGGCSPRTSQGVTPLHLACTSHQKAPLPPYIDLAGEKAALALIRAGADLHAETSSGETALLLACEAGCLAVVAALRAAAPGMALLRVQRKATLDSPLHLAARNGHLEVVRALLLTVEGAVDPEVAIVVRMRDKQGRPAQAPEGRDAPAINALIKQVEEEAERVRKERGQDVWNRTFSEYQRTCGDCLVAVLDSGMEDGYKMKSGGIS